MLLEEAIKLSPSATLAAEPLLFNLCKLHIISAQYSANQDVATMYELRSAAGADKKRNLLTEVAKWAGDGLRITCLKMPTN